MKNVLFITESYHYSPSPNGNCVEKVVKELINDGNNVSVLTFMNQYINHDEIIDGAYIYRVPSYIEWRIQYSKVLPSTLKRVSQHAIALFKLLMNPFHPFRSIGVYRLLVKRGRRIIEDRKIDTIVCVYRDFETTYAGVRLKELYPNVKTVIYSLDAISGGVCSNKTISMDKHIERCRKWEKYFISVCDCFCAMNSHKNWLSNSYYDSMRSKITYMDIPTLSFEDFSDCNLEYSESSPIKFVYTGMLSETNADCTFFLGILPFLAEKIKVRFDIYGGVSKGLENHLNSSGLKDKIVFFHGKIDKKQLSEVRRKGDVFLNFGNEHSCGIPCKIFEYLGTGKIILSFYRIDEDASKPYLEKYPKALVLREKTGSESEYADRIFEFYKNNCSVNIGVDQIKNTYYHNTAEAMCKLIEE